MPILKKGLLVTALCAILPACVSIPDQVQVVRNRASYDFDCAPERIEVVWLQSGMYGAQGCRNKQIYEVQGTLVYKEGAAPNPVYMEPAFRVGYGHHYYH